MLETMMLGQAATQGLADVPTAGGFFSLLKIAVMAVFLFLWAFPAGWCSRDAQNLSLNRSLWGTIILVGAIVGWFFWFLIPIYMVGLLSFLVFSFGSILAYAMYRDSLIDDNDKILNPTNFMSIFRSDKASKFEVQEKVRLSTPQGHEPKIPEDLQGQKLYQSFQDLIFDGLWRRAEEILLQPAGEHVRVTLRIDGVKNEYAQWDRAWTQEVIDYVKTICQLDAKERRQPQKGKLVAQLVSVNRKVTLDIETAGSTAGERLGVRVRAEESKFTIDDIGFTEDQSQKIEKILSEKRGLILLSGMHGAGTSSTLYAIGRSLDAFTQNIHSVELKPLMDLDNITQNVYPSGSDKTFDKYIQSISRREPDVILVDPCHQAETAKMLAQIVSAKNKKIFTTLRAGSTLSALGRVLRWVDSAETTGEVLLATTFQRLVRKLCPACREAYKPNTATLRKMNLSASESVTFYRPPSQQLVDKKGNPIICPTCQGSGYLGRTGVFELLIVEDPLREAIKQGDAVKIKSAARKTGFKSWEEVAMEKVSQGITSVQEVIRVSKEADALRGKKSNKTDS